eukprot:COSAG01_NODE_1672_length_9554_cov_4.065785_8_plen_86_part_00
MVRKHIAAAASRHELALLINLGCGRVLRVPEAACTAPPLRARPQPQLSAGSYDDAQLGVHAPVGGAELHALAWLGRPPGAVHAQA